MGNLGLRRQAERDAALAQGDDCTVPPSKALSPLSTLRSAATEDGRSASAVQKFQSANNPLPAATQKQVLPKQRSCVIRLLLGQN